MSNKKEKIDIERLIQEAESSINHGHHKKAKKILNEAEEYYDRSFYFSVKSGNPNPSILLEKQKVLRINGNLAQDNNDHRRIITHMLYDLKKVIESSDIVIKESTTQGLNFSVKNCLKYKTEAYTELAKLHLDPRFQISKDDIAWSRVYLDKAVASARSLNEISKNLDITSNINSTNILSDLLYRRADLKSSFMNEFESSLKDLNEGQKLLEELIEIESKCSQGEEIKDRFPNIKLISYNRKKNTSEKLLSDFRIKKGHVYLYMQKEDKAIIEFLESDCPSGDYNAGEISIMMEKKDQGIDYLIKSIDKNVEEDYVSMNSFQLLQELSSSCYQESLDNYQSDPKSASINLGRSIRIINYFIKIKDKKFMDKEHIKQLEKFKNEVYRLKGLCHINLNEFDIAIEEFKQIENYLRDHSIGYTLVLQEEYLQAINHLTKAIGDNPVKNEFDIQTLDSSCKSLIHSISMISNEETDWFRTYGNFSEISIYKFNQCINACETTLSHKNKINPEYIDHLEIILKQSFNNRGVANYAKKRLYEAKEDFDKSGTPDSLYNAAEISFQLNQFEQSRKYLNRIIIQSDHNKDRDLISRATLFLMDLIKGKYV